MTLFNLTHAVSQIDAKAYTAFFDQHRNARSAEVTLCNINEAMLPHLPPRPFDKLQTLKIHVDNAEHLIDRFLTSSVTSLELHVTAKKNPDVLSTLSSTLNRLAPTMHPMSGLVIVGSYQEPNLRGLSFEDQLDSWDPAALDVCWWWKFIRLLPTLTYLTVFGARNCTVPQEMLSLVSSLEFLTTLQLDARYPTGGEHFWGDSLQHTLEHLKSQRLESLWLRLADQATIDFSVLERFHHLHDINLGADCPETGSSENIRKLGKLTNLRKVALCTLYMETTMDYELFSYLISQWPLIKAITLLEYRTDETAGLEDLRIQDLDTIGILAPRLQWLKVHLAINATGSLPPISAFPKGMTLDMGHTPMERDQENAVIEALRALGLEDNKLRSRCLGPGWVTTMTHFGWSDPKDPRESDVVIF